mmetsp:Transcript_979/g.1231  ORF Transcript_979/g.1231 Transcript_979/m.1231 type:complete len:175 (+) Transcript_979:200-724(+)|eukprot:CAMPEP_0204828100 /NCGR_PEP_ID=MMETSP1346-20131115/5709_1 /ASSEMBLY_ACC=CAM_ASM_000771 /TAXON_ID=215587 /ORGANISM="Aplanochytrium stocchinoi, Strain GSBS06" /LENGTH=174 /DNA_ID=CAMNT_0051956909 /DNA_START=269 /DNA_END=793 /DNA_ORIENTATION=-
MANAELMTGLGAAFSVFLSCLGSAYATVYAGVFALRSSNGLLGFTPVVIAGVLAIYGIIIAVILSGKLNDDKNPLTEADGYKHLSAGLSVGFACLASGLGIGKFLQTLFVIDLTQKSATPSSSATVAGSDSADQPLLDSAPKRTSHIGQVLTVLVFIEAIGLYGLIVALILSAS